MATNGESWLLERLGAEARIVLDVGANHGDWTLRAREESPQGEIHCFEVVGPVREQLRERIGPLENVHVAGCGL